MYCGVFSGHSGVLYALCWVYTFSFSNLTTLHRVTTPISQQFTSDLEQTAMSGSHFSRPQLKAPGTEGTSSMHLPGWRSSRDSAQLGQRIRTGVAVSDTSALPMEGLHTLRSSLHTPMSEPQLINSSPLYSRRLINWRETGRNTPEAYARAPPQSPQTSQRQLWPTQNSQWPPLAPPPERGVTPYGSRYGM